MTEILRHGLTKLFQKLFLKGIAIVLKVETVVFEKTTALSIFQQLWLWLVRIVTNKQRSTSWVISDIRIGTIKEKEKIQWNQI
jgi:hypothetical protein